MNNLRLSSKVDVIKPSASLAVASRAAELRREGRDIVNLSLGEPDFDVPAPLKSGLYQALDENKTHYTPSQGVPEIREEIAKVIGHGMEADQVILCSGAKLGIYLTLEAIVDPGDEVILVEPAWVSYEHMITLAHGKSVNVQTKKENDFLPTIEDIKAAISDKSKAIILNTPNNPSGKVIPKEILDQIVELAKEHEMFIISDEIYSDVLFEGEFYSAINYDYERIILNSGFSKNFAMTGLRLGYVAAKNKQVAKAIAKLHQHVGTCAPSVAQFCLNGNIAQVLNNDVKEMVKTYKRRRELLVEGLKDSIFDLIVPDATFYMLLDVSKLGMKSLEASTYLLENFGVATVPGIGFGVSIDNYVRISFATSEEQLQKAMDRLNEVKALV